MEIVLHSKENEDALIGSVLINPEVYQECAAMLDAADFYHSGNRAIWKAFARLHSQKQDIDQITVSDIVKADGVQFSELIRMVSLAPNSYNAKSYAEVIKDKARRRQQVQIAQEIVSGAHNGGVKVADVMGKLISTTNIKRKVEHIGEELSRYYDHISERFANPKEVWGIPTTYKEFDKSTGGLHKGHVVMISGAPGAGKSVLAANIILKSAMQGASWAVFSLEMAKHDLINRWVGMLTGLSEDKLSSGTFDESKWPLITHAIETLESLSIYINDTPAVTTTDISADIAKLQSEKQVDAICLDYLELLGDTAETKNEATGIKSTRFREICRERDLAGLVIQSMNKEGIGAATGGVTQAQGGKKSFSSTQAAMVGISGPAGVMHDADTVFMLVVDPEDLTGKTIAALPAKKRHGNGDKKPLRFKWHDTAPILIPADKEFTFAPNK